MNKNPLVKLFTKSVASAAQSLVSSEIKKHAKGFIDKVSSKSKEQAAAEAAARVGYPTEHFTLDKKQNVVFKSSSMFLHEWLNNCPSVAGKLLKDEETGQIYYGNQLLSNSNKVELLTKFAKATGIHSPAMSGHFDQAVNLLDVQDYTALKFEKEFAGWDASRTSVINSWLSNVFGSALETDLTYANMLFRKWIIGTAKRAMSPGSTLDGCLTFKGPPGVGKTQHFRKLLPEPFAGRTGEIYCDVKSPQRFVESIVGKTVACFDELAVLDNPKSDEIFKQLLTSQFIDVRLAWARKPRRFALRSGFSATTNRQKFITDKTLSRRLWVIELNSNSRMNFDFVNENRRALWMEAVFHAQKDVNGTGCILSPDEQKEVEEYNKNFWMP